ncbi:MAG: DUF3558 domain-containing protein [Umezawaea sp.]
MIRPLATTALCLLALAACSSPQSGTAAPATTGQSATTKPSTEPVSTRPREVDLTGADPCGLMTADQLAEIGETTTPKPGTSPTFKSPNCTFNTTGATWRITTVATEGIEAWTSGKRQGQPADIPPISGFRAITVTVPTDAVACDIAVDVAAGQYLYAGFEVSKSFAAKFPKPCDGARTVAEAAMKNLTK